VTATSIHRRIAASIFAFAIANLAHAELPERAALQVLEPILGTDTTNTADEPPDPPWMGIGMAMQGNVALVGMSGAFGETGRVAAFVRDATGKWMRRQTLTASDAAPSARFGDHVAIFNSHVLIAARTAVYVFELTSGKWRQTGKLAFGRSVTVRDLDWHWNTVVVGARDSTGNAAYVFHLNADGTFQRIARLAPPDAVAGDLFGEHVAVYSASVAATAPGYNSEQGAAYTLPSISRAGSWLLAHRARIGYREIHPNCRVSRTIMPQAPPTCSCAATARGPSNRGCAPAPGS
jgi:hypothetical protein